MFFIYFVMMNVGEDPPSLGLMLTSSLLCWVSSSLSPLSANIACTTAFVATTVIWAMVLFMYA